MALKNQIAEIVILQSYILITRLEEAVIKIDDKDHDGAHFLSQLSY